jgi:hypothetical protein
MAVQWSPTCPLGRICTSAAQTDTSWTWMAQGGDTWDIVYRAAARNLGVTPLCASSSG